METGPVFIGGLSHSGKTYLRLMLNRHPNLVVTRRTKMWARYHGRFGPLSNPDNFERCLTTMLQSRAIQQELAPDASRIRTAFWQDAPTYPRLFALFHQQHAERIGKPRWGDQHKRLETFADAIFNAFPDAKMIHMVRDPRERYQAHAAAARYPRIKLGWETAEWRHSARLARQNLARYPNRYRVVAYEQLLEQPERTLRQLCIFLGERFVPDMLTAEGVPSSCDHPATMPGRTLALVQAGVGREMAALAYRPWATHLTVRDWLLLPLLDGPFSLAGEALWWMGEGRKSAGLATEPARKQWS